MKKSNQLPAIVIFKGTDDLSGFKRDIDFTGIGKKVYENYAHKIVDNILALGSQDVEIIGHSLGGVDAQRLVVSLSECVLQSAKINQIEMFTFCSPKLDGSTITEWKKCQLELETSKSDLGIDLHYIFHLNDIITWAGSSYLTGDRYSKIATHCFVVASDNLSDINSHHSNKFFKDGRFNYKIDGRTYQVYHSESNKSIDLYKQKIHDRTRTPWIINCISQVFIDPFSRESASKILDRIEIDKVEIERYLGNSRDIYGVISHLYHMALSVFFSNKSNTQVKNSSI